MNIVIFRVVILVENLESDEIFVKIHDKVLFVVHEDVIWQVLRKKPVEIYLYKKDKIKLVDLVGEKKLSDKDLDNYIIEGSVVFSDDVTITIFENYKSWVSGEWCNFIVNNLVVILVEIKVIIRLMIKKVGNDKVNEVNYFKQQVNGLVLKN